MTFVSIARSSNQSFPYVTIPEYGVHVAKALSLTGALGTYLLPVVSSEHRSEWERYAARKNGNVEAWVNKSLYLQDAWDKFYGPMPQNFTWESKDIIHGDFGIIPYNESRNDRLDLLLPEWHKFPLVMTLYSPVNWGKIL
jgi:hypothetical protein